MNTDREPTIPSLLCFLHLHQPLHLKKKIQCNSLLWAEIIVAINLYLYNVRLNSFFSDVKMHSKLISK